jgi:hypothetical protein
MHRQGAKDAKIQDPGDEIDRQAHAVIGAAIEVHRWLGPGSLEAVYEEALCVELELRGIPFARQVPVAIPRLRPPAATPGINEAKSAVAAVEPNYKGRRIGESRTDEPWRTWRLGGSSSASG